MNLTEQDDCPFCGTGGGALVPKSEVVLTHTPNGTPFEYESHYWKCKECGADFPDGRLLDLNAESLRTERSIAMAKEKENAGPSTSGDTNAGDA